MGFENKEGESFFFKKLKENITNVLFFLFMFFSLLLCFWCLKKICDPSIYISNDIKIIIDLVKE
jgi:hypothetical protein